MTFLVLYTKAGRAHFQGPFHTIDEANDAKAWLVSLGITDVVISAELVQELAHA